MHAQFMHRCLELAESARGQTGSNPMVGAVLVRDEKIIAEGVHSKFGEVHAERQLLEKFEQKISSKDILYVNLEPCSHSNKKTPPCAQYLIEKGIKTVVFGMIDPNPAVSGKGIGLLKKSGVAVIGPVLLADCLRLNRGFVSVQTKGRPWITLHEARTTDGRHAKPDGSPLKITDETQDIWTHQSLRAKHDAILVGIGTILADDPRLNVRYSGAPLDIFRIILDRSFSIPTAAKVVNGELARGTIVVTKEKEEIEEKEEREEKRKILEGRGVRILEVPSLAVRGSGYSTRGGISKALFDWQTLWKKLTTPDGEFHGITSILLEGGPKTWNIFRTAKMVDEEVVLVGRMNN